MIVNDEKGGRYWILSGQQRCVSWILIIFSPPPNHHIFCSSQYLSIWTTNFTMMVMFVTNWQLKQLWWLGLGRVHTENVNLVLCQLFLSISSQSRQLLTWCPQQPVQLFHFPSFPFRFARVLSNRSVLHHFVSWTGTQALWLFILSKKLQTPFNICALSSPV